MHVLQYIHLTSHAVLTIIFKTFFCDVLAFRIQKPKINICNFTGLLLDTWYMNTC